MSGWLDFTELKLMLRALGNNTSLNILHQLAGQHEITVTELVLALGVSQPLVSWHLRNLRRQGFVRTRRRGREVYCSLDPTRIAACQRALGELVGPEAGSAAPLPPSPYLPSLAPEPVSGTVAVRQAPQENIASGPHARAGPAPG